MFENYYNILRRKHQNYNRFFIQKTLVSAEESTKLEHLLDEYPSLRLILDLKQLHQPVSLYHLLQVTFRRNV